MTVILSSKAKSKQKRKEKVKMRSYWKLLMPNDYLDKMVGEKMVNPVRR